MKKLLLAASLMAVTTAGFANDVKDRDGFYGVAELVETDFDVARNVSDKASGRIALGWMFNKNWAVEGNYSYMNDLEKFASSWDMGTGPTDIEAYGLDLIYNDTSWLGNTTTNPFFKLGMGKYDAKPHPWTWPASQIEDSEYVKVGLGVQHFASKNLFLRAGIDFIDGSNEFSDDKQFYVGLGYFFGTTHGAALAPVKTPEAPKDSDGDGVIDANDRCPGTPAGARVDSYGCPLDSDGDGVYDYQDACPNTPAGAKVDSKGCRVQLEEKVVIDMRLNFDTNKSAIKPGMVSEITKVAEFMRQYPDVSAEIQGHTDSIGAASYNKKLSQRRADSVVNYLVNNFGISAARLSGVGYGEDRPIADNATAEGRAQNRRAEAHLETVVTK